MFYDYDYFIPLHGNQTVSLCFDLQCALRSTQVQPGDIVAGRKALVLSTGKFCQQQGPWYEQKMGGMVLVQCMIVS